MAERYRITGRASTSRLFTPEIVPLFPAELQTERLTLRCRFASDVDAMKRAIDENLAHLQAWMGWAMDEPSPREVLAARFEHFNRQFADDEDWNFGIFERATGRVLGTCGAHRQADPDVLEIGYWIVASDTRRGYATEATRALTGAAFAIPSIARVQIRCDPHNVASARIPEKLGYRHIATLVNDTTTPKGDPRDTMVWELTRQD